MWALNDHCNVTPYRSLCLMHQWHHCYQYTNLDQVNQNDSGYLLVFSQYPIAQFPHHKFVGFQWCCVNLQHATMHLATMQNNELDPPCIPKGNVVIFYSHKIHTDSILWSCKVIKISYLNVQKESLLVFTNKVWQKWRIELYSLREFPISYMISFSTDTFSRLITC